MILPLLIIGAPVLFFALAPKEQQTAFVPGYQNGNAGNRTMTGSQPVFTSPIYTPQSPVIQLPSSTLPATTRIVNAPRVSPAQFKAALKASPNAQLALKQAVSGLRVPAWFRSRLLMGIR